MQDNEKKITAVRRYLTSLEGKGYNEDEILVNIWNRYCDSAGYQDDMIYRMSELNELLEGYKPMEVAEMIHFGNFNPMHEYFYFDGYGNLGSFEFLEYSDCGYDEYALSEYAVEQGDDLENDEIAEILADE